MKAKRSQKDNRVASDDVLDMLDSTIEIHVNVAKNTHPYHCRDDKPLQHLNNTECICPVCFKRFKTSKVSTYLVKMLMGAGILMSNVPVEPPQGRAATRRSARTGCSSKPLARQKSKNSHVVTI
jgi:hypothetical protein